MNSERLIPNQDQSTKYFIFDRALSTDRLGFRWSISIDLLRYEVRHSSPYSEKLNDVFTPKSPTIYNSLQIRLISLFLGNQHGSAKQIPVSFMYYNNMAVALT